MFLGCILTLLFYKCLQLRRYLWPGHKLGPVSSVIRGTPDFATARLQHFHAASACCLCWGPTGDSGDLLDVKLMNWWFSGFPDFSLFQGKSSSSPRSSSACRYQRGTIKPRALSWQKYSVELPTWLTPSATLQPSSTCAALDLRNGKPTGS